MSEESPWDRARARLADDWTVPRRPPDDEILRARTIAIAQSIETRPESVAEARISARVGDATLLVPAATVGGVQPYVDAVRLPGTPVHLLGLTRLRGRLAPLWDIGPLIAGRATPTLDADARIVTLGSDEPELVIVVERVLDLDPLEGVAPAPPPVGSPPWLEGLGPNGELCLNVTALAADPRLRVDHRHDP